MSRRSFGLRAAAAGLGLGFAWALFHGWRLPDHVLTRFGEALPLAPLYAFFDPVARWPLALLAGAILAAGVALLPRIRARSWFLLALVVFCAAFRLSVHGIRTPGPPGAELALYAGEEVVDDLPRIESPGRFLRDYVAIQPTLSLHGRTKPPGLALFYYGLTRVAGTRLQVTGTVITLLGCLIVLPAYFLACRVLEDRDLARRAAVLTAVMPSGVLFGAVSFDAVLAPVLLAPIALAAAEARSPRAWRRFTLGGLLGLGLMLTYSTLPAGLLIVTALIVAWRDEARRIPLRLLEIGAATLALPIALYVATGFDAWGCLVQARALNTALLRAASGSRLAGSSAWLYGSVGNLLAFTLSLGVPVVVGLCALRWSRFDRAQRAWLVALASTLAVAGLGGIYWMETERILLFLAPLPAVLAVRELPAGPAWLVSGGQAMLAEALLYTLW